MSGSPLETVAPDGCRGDKGLRNNRSPSAVKAEGYKEIDTQKSHTTGVSFDSVTRAICIPVICNFAHEPRGPSLRSFAAGRTADLVRAPARHVFAARP